MDLAELQERLSQQYARLCDKRAGENYAVYAIEHGLSADERKTAKALLNSNLSSTMRADRAHWLVWVAAAAEIGYIYDGTEYWDSFAAAFPDWPRFGDRNQIRAWYEQFAAQFRGLTPAGPWARQFPIIAWPITQAILPRYLQRHFADHLYDQRHALVRTGELTLDEIGELLSDRYYGSSSRFEGFLQQKTLTARIVMALGLEGVQDAVAPIDKVTLDRIVADFDRLGSFGMRLREARRVLREARFINSAKPGFVPKTPLQQKTAQPSERFERPRLLARPISETEWSLSLALPDLATPLRRAGVSPRDLEQAKMRFRSHGEGSAWAPGRALFSYIGEAEEPLLAYPTNDLAVFAFERPLAKAEEALAGMLTFPAAPMRLLKVRADGVAVELFGRRVRANQSYVLAISTDIPSCIAQSLSLSPVQTKTSCVRLWYLRTPQKLEAEKIAALKSLGLGYALGVRAEPLGLSPRWGAADDALVFLDTEVPMFCLSADVAVREYVVAIDSALPVRLKAATNNNTLISLGQLAVGSHLVAFTALGAATGEDILAEGFNIEIRPASPWQKSIAGKSGVSLALDPRDATLEQLLDRAALIRAIAPPGRTIKLDGHFFKADSTLFHEETFGRYNTPITDTRLSELVVQKLTSNALAEHVERAVRIEVLISLDEYGAERIAFEKNAEPLRWLRVNGRIVRLSDDTAETSPPTIERYDFDAVETACIVDYQQALQGLEIKGKGGLFVATLNRKRYGAIVTALQPQLTNFGDLGVPANVSSREQRPQIFINALKRWQAARRSIGPMAHIARRNAISVLEDALEGLLCGADWHEAVTQVRAGTLAIGDLYARVYYSRGFAAGLRAFDWRYASDRAAAETEFLRLIKVYKLPTDDAHYRLALKLAFCPQNVRRSDLPTTEVFETLTTSAVIRGAYFARLATDLNAQNERAEAA